MNETINLLGRRKGLLETLEMDVVEATKERVVVTMPVSPRHLQPRGYLHGGASLALAETAASVGASINAPAGMVAFGQEINANHIRSVQNGLLTATATPVHIGRTSQVWQIFIRDERDRLICVSRCTLAVVPATRDGGD
jgi:1,4-dihydroxy-2-naphthoyl-CoA hydrolase